MIKRRTISALGATIAAAMLAASSIPAVAQDEVTLTFWTDHPEWKDRVQVILDVFEEQHPNINIDLESINGPDYIARMSTALVTGEGPDIVGMQPGANMRVTAESGYVQDLTDILDVSSVNDSGIAASQVDGSIYGVPMLGVPGQHVGDSRLTGG